MPAIPKDPLDWLTLFRQQINVIFNFLSTIDEKDVSGEYVCAPQIDMFETADSFILEIDLPGFDRKDLSLSACCNMLVIEGVKRKESHGKNVKYICLERCFGRFRKTIEIPPAAELDKVAARYDKGVLVVSFPRLPEQSVIREIPIG